MPQIPDHILDRIRESVDIVDYISRYLNLRKTGKNYKAVCPFHTEKTPSFTVSPDKQIFYCFGCGAGGNVYNFIMRYEKISFIEAVKKLSAETGIELPRYRDDNKKSSEYEQLYRANQLAANFYSEQLNKHFSSLKDYLEKRQIRAEIIDHFKVGFVPDLWDSLCQEINRKKYPLEPFLKAGLILESEKDRTRKYDRFRHRLMFPIHNLSGRVVAFGGRTLSQSDDTPKYLNSPESPIYNKSQILYGLFYSKDWIRQEEFVILVEGYMDYLQLYQNDIRNVAATSGTALTTEHARIIRRYTGNVVLCYDADNAGIQAAIRGGQILFQENLDVKVLILPKEEDPDSFVRTNGKTKFLAILDQAQNYLDFKLNQLQKNIGFEDVSQKTRVVNEMISSIAAHSDPLKQNFYANAFAQKFNLQEATLLEQIKRASKTIRARENKASEPAKSENIQPQTRPVLTGAWNAEKDILIILLNHFDKVKNIIFQLVEADDFLNEEFRQIFILLKDEGSSHQNDLLHWVLGQIEDEKITGLLTADLFSEIQNPDRYLNDCIQKIKITRYQYKVDQLRQQLRQMETHNPEYNAILRDVNDNLMKIQKIRKIFASRMTED